MLTNANLFDTQKIFNDESLDIKKTWIKNKTTKRRLDYIWISENLLDDLMMTDIKEIVNLESDYKILNMIINKNICEKLMRNNSREKRNKYIRTVFNITKINN